jgi:putative transposase
MSRLIPPELLDLSTWPTVDPTALEEPRRGELLQRMQAVRLYAGSAAVHHIETTTGVVRSQLYRLLRQCTAVHPDGRIQGFRALIPYTRTKPYQRTKPVRATTRARRAGSSGAMAALLQRYDSLSALLRRSLSEREVFIGERNQLCGLHTVHRRFIAACRELGLTAHDYPLNQERHGVRGLARAIRLLATQTFADGARSAGAMRVAPPWGSQASSAAANPLRPLEVVEFDGHKLDVRLHVRFADAAGIVEDIDINRVWLLVIIDVCSRAILGWNLVLAAEYNRNDVIRTVQQALLPQRKRAQLSIPGLSYAPSGGFVGEVIPALNGACWDRLRLDNARANLAVDTLALLGTVVGCVAEAGPLAEPTERPFVERFFGTLTTTLSHRLPGTTGSRPHDVRRRIADAKGKDALSVSFDELLELVEVNVANYNGEPHGGIGERTPLEFLQRSMALQGDCVRVLSEPFRRQLCILQPSRICTVAGSLRNGVRPYVSVHGVRYSSRLLQQAADLIGQRLRVHIDPQDLRVVHAYLASGEELGPLNAARPWHRTPHSLRLRQEILRLRRQRKLHFTQTDDPVEVFLQAKRKQLVKQRGRTNHRSAEAARATAASPAPMAVAAPAAELALPPALAPVKPRALSRIGKGQVFGKGEP